MPCLKPLSVAAFTMQSGHRYNIMSPCPTFHTSSISVGSSRIIVTVYKIKFLNDLVCASCHDKFIEDSYSIDNFNIISNSNFGII